MTLKQEHKRNKNIETNHANIIGLAESMMKDYEAITIGASAGGMEAIKNILSNLKNNFSLPIIIVQHLHPQGNDFFAHHLNSMCSLTVKEAEQREKIKRGTVYLAPPNYHLLIEEDKTFSLSTDNKVNYSRPSIDVLFESASEIYGPKLIGIILTGANSDGAVGLKKVKNKKGLAIVQDPSTAKVKMMPESAIKNANVDFILPLDEIGHFLNKVDDDLNSKE